MEGLLGIYAYRDYLKSNSPSTVHDLVPLIFPELSSTSRSRLLRIPSRVTKPERFSFSVRDLLDEEFMIEPTSNLAEHLKMSGNAIKVYVLESSAVKFLMSYHKNRVAT